MDSIPNLIIISINLILAFICLIRFLINRFSPVKTVKAVVVHKQTVEGFSKYNGKGKGTKYVVTFRADEKTLSFYVCAFSYQGYNVNETGMLTYKGNKLIDFS